MTTDTDAPASPRPAAVPYLAVADARAAIEWYIDILGARLDEDPIVMPDGRVGHAELHWPSGVIYLADEHPELGVAAPRPGAAAVSLMLPVPDADAARARAVAAGASGDRPPYDGYGTRNAWIVDPFEHRWCLESPLRPPGQPDVPYVSLNVPDAERARRFYAAALGWRFDSGRPAGLRPEVGVYETAGAPTLFCCFRVDDVDAAVDRVRGAGGAATEPETRAYGRLSDCVDDQDMAFALLEGERDPADELDLWYLTLHVRDSARTRAFFDAVLGWETTPGRIADGWQVTNTVPLIGFHGGHDEAAALPMWRVPDIVAVAAEVRAAGGTATDPEQQPYGITSECVDDQGLRFYLGQE